MIKCITMEPLHKQIIERYISAYNAFDVEGMMRDLSPDVVFENISDGEITLRLEGVEAFRKQAELALSYFSKRTQLIQQWRIEANKISVDIDYEAVLAMDFPNGMKKGDQLQLKGSSDFEFKAGKIVLIRDKS